MLTISNVTKTYQSGDTSISVLNNISIQIEKGTTNSIVGPSGSGKTTLLGICAGLDTPTEGTVSLLNHPLSKLSEDERAAVRSQHVGFVFQSFQLIPTLTALENVLVPAELRGNSSALTAAKDLLRDVGLGDRSHHYPTQLSGGEQQRVALARAFINRPDILFADEPTGNLDRATGQIIEELLFDLNKSYGTTLVIVTHDLELAQKTERILSLAHGDLASDKHLSHKEQA